MEALNRQEIAKKEYSDAQRQLDLLAADLEKIKKEAEKVDELYAEQDELLGRCPSMYTNPPSRHMPTYTSMDLFNKDLLEPATVTCMRFTKLVH